MKYVTGLYLSMFVAPFVLANNFQTTENTINGLHLALNNKSTTCEAVVAEYIERIKVYDFQINSVIAINEKAIDEAKQLDAKPDSQKNGALFCVPVLIKDNIDTKEMPTTVGVKAFANNQPPHNAPIVDSLLNAGAIIIGKTNMDEFAISLRGVSSILGTTKNVYDFDMNSGGSSGGTASAISASFAMVGLGTDTGGSIRMPSSLAGLIGIRPTTANSNTQGVAPLSHTQDTVGPMCRSVDDCALVLSVIEQNVTDERKQSILNAAKVQNLQGKNIAFVEEMFPARDEAHEIYWKVIDNAVMQMKNAGAQVDIVKLPNFATLFSDYTSLSRFEFKGDIEQYLQSWSSDKDNHIRTFDELLSSGGFHEDSKLYLEMYAQKYDGRDTDPAYDKNMNGRTEVFRSSILSVLDGKVKYDALLYPSLTELNVPAGQVSAGFKNAGLSPFSGYPAIAFPIGLTDEAKPRAIGLEFLGRENAEPELIELAAGFEHHLNMRVTPSNFDEF